MERVTITEPEHYPYSMQLPVRITDLNYGKHVGNDRLLGMIHEARVQFLQFIGIEELPAQGVGLIMADVAISFKKEITYGQVVQVQVAATSMGRSGFDLVYRLSVEVDGSFTTAALAKTGMVCFDYDKRKKVSLSEEWTRLLAPGRMSP